MDPEQKKRVARAALFWYHKTDSLPASGRLREDPES